MTTTDTVHITCCTSQLYIILHTVYTTSTENNKTRMYLLCQYSTEFIPYFLTV